MLVVYDVEIKRTSDWRTRLLLTLVTTTNLIHLSEDDRSQQQNDMSLRFLALCVTSLPP